MRSIALLSLLFLFDAPIVAQGIDLPSGIDPFSAVSTSPPSHDTLRAEPAPSEWLAPDEDISASHSRARDPRFLMRFRGGVVCDPYAPVPSYDAAFPSSSPFQVVLGEEPYPLPYEGYDPEVTRIRWDHAAIVSGALTATVAAIHVYQANAWWSENRGSFHFVEDNLYALNVDKAGHFFGGAFAAFMGKKSLVWSGVSDDASAWWGWAMGTLFELYVEFEDGFARDWGFSPGDAYADVIGSSWTLGQHFVPFMQHLQPKFTYYPSKKFREGRHHGNAIDDYEGQTYWMGIHVDGLLPHSMKDWWPDWLAVAVGVSIRDIDDRTRTQRNVILSLDYDFTKILPGDSWWMRTLKEALNYVHFPAPAIRISPNYVAYGLYF